MEAITEHSNSDIRKQLLLLELTLKHIPFEPLPKGDLAGGQKIY